jgi:hypothetical protein
MTINTLSTATVAIARVADAVDQSDEAALGNLDGRRFRVDLTRPR